MDTTNAEMPHNLDQLSIGQVCQGAEVEDVLLCDLGGDAFAFLDGYDLINGRDLDRFLFA